jgi:S1-C subfamily serine protease
VTLPITVLRVDPSGPAAAAGIQPGDHIVSVDGRGLDGLLPLSVWYLLIDHAPGTTAVLGIERGGTVRQVSLKLGAQ